MVGIVNVESFERREESCNCVKVDIFSQVYDESFLTFFKTGQREIKVVIGFVK